MDAAAAAAWNIEGIGDSSDDCGVGGSFSLLEVDGADVDKGVEVLADTDVELSVVLRLAFEAERRIVGVRSDSRALGSSSAVYFPIAGRWKIYQNL